MKNNFTDLPKFVSVEEYHASITRMVNSLSSNKDILGIYQIGGINTPGISDIDLYIVFKDGVHFTRNPVSGISESDRYLFCHNLFGTCESIALQMEKFTFFGNFKLLYGKELDFANYQLHESDRELLKKQIALEYLIKAWLSISIQLFYGLIKTRGLLLHSKAILYDLDFLNIKSGSLKDTVTRLMQIRNSWFENKTDFSELEQLCKNYCSELHQTITTELKNCGFYIDNKDTFQIAKRITISNSAKLDFKSQGLKIPAIITSQSHILQKIQNRLHHFKIGVPFAENSMPSILLERRKTIQKAILYNREYLPDFISGGFPLQIFL